MTDSEFRLEERILCEDDTCIGLVGADGRCRECGRKYTGDLSALNGLNEHGATSETPQNENEEAAADPSSDEAEGSDVDDRVLCADDLCVGIIGADGRCGTCGKKP